MLNPINKTDLTQAHTDPLLNPDIGENQQPNELTQVGELNVNLRQPLTATVSSSDVRATSTPNIALSQSSSATMLNSVWKNTSPPTPTPQPMKEPGYDSKGKEYRHLTDGGCKSVFTSKDKAFYTGINGNKSATNELKTEVGTAHAIQASLKKCVLHDFLSQCKGLNKDQIPTMIEQFESVEDLINNIGKLDDSQQAALRSFMGTSEGADAVEKANKAGQFLALKLEEVPKGKEINGWYTVETDFANQGDLEDYMRGERSIDDRLAFCSQFMQGLADLHKAGFVHGDIKPENMLVNVDPETNKTHIRISDWGKADKIPEGEVSYKANTRHMAWEGRLSEKSEVCSAGICLIRMLEIAVLDKNEPMLIEPKNKSKYIEASKDRLGFEAFVIESRDFNGIEPDKKDPNQGLISKGKQYVASRFKQVSTRVLGERDQEKLMRMEKEKNDYIDELTNRLKDRGILPKQACYNLNGCLRSMTAINPQDRPSMEQANSMINDIIQLYQKTPGGIQ